MVIAKEQCLECGICEKVCPIYENILIPKQAQYNTITGNYLNCYKGTMIDIGKRVLREGF